MDNYFTQPDRRPPKSVDKGEIEEILEKGVKLPYKATADIAGAKIGLHTNSEHVFKFWKLNWFLTKSSAQGMIYVVNGVKGYDSHLFYDLKGRKILIVNCEYYGAAKSAGALGLVGAILEGKADPIHGACVSIEKNGMNEGVIIIAPTGTGKTTQSHELTYRLRNSKVHSDDYVFVFFNDRPIAKATEKQLYMRTDIAKEHPTFRHLFDELPLENVVNEKSKCAEASEDEEKMGSCFKDVRSGKMKCMFDEGKKICYWSYANSRVMFPREIFPMQVRDKKGYLHEMPKGKNNVINEAVVKYVFLLTRDKETPPARMLEKNEVIDILKQGRFLIRPGAGPPEKWGTMGNEPFYNPYPAELDHKAQEKFFKKLYDSGVLFYMMNTGSYESRDITPHQTHTYIRTIVEG